MKVSIDESNQYNEVEIIIKCQRIDDTILQIMSSIQRHDKRITGTRDSQVYLLDPKDIYYFDTVDDKVFIYTENAVYETPLKLYMLLQKLENSDFARANKATIVNLLKIRSFVPFFSGKLEATMLNGEKLYVSRQFVKPIKDMIGM